MSIFGSQIAGLGFNLFGAHRANKRWNEFQQQQVDPFNQWMQQQAGQMGGYGQQAQQFAQQGIQQGNQYFDPNRAYSQYQSAMSPALQGYYNQSGISSQNTAQQQAAFGGVQQQYGQGAAGVSQGYGQLGGFAQEQLGRSRGLVDRMGTQGRADINQGAQDLLSSQMQGLTARGLGGTTVASSTAGMVERERQGALGRHREQMLGQQLGVERGFGGDYMNVQGQGLGAQQQMTGFGANLGLAGAQGLQSGQQFGQGVGMQAIGGIGAIGQGQYGAVNQAQMNTMNNMMGFGGYGINTGMQAGQRGSVQ